MVFIRRQGVKMFKATFKQAILSHAISLYKTYAISLYKSFGMSLYKHQTETFTPVPLTFPGLLQGGACYPNFVPQALHEPKFGVVRRSNEEWR
jgi:hypothetical protein